MDLYDLTDELIEGLKNVVVNPMNEFLEYSTDQIIDAYVGNLTDDEVAIINKDLDKRKAKLKSEINDGFKILIVAFLLSLAVELSRSDVEKIATVIYKYNAKSIDAIVTQTTKTTKTMIKKATVANSKFDKWFKYNLQGVKDIKLINKRIQIFKNLFGNEYRASISKKLFARINKGEIELVREALTRKGYRNVLIFKKGGRRYNIDAYINRMAEYELNETVRNVYKVQIHKDPDKYDIVALIQTRRPKEPRSTHIEAERELYSMSGKSEEYSSVAVLANLPPGDEIYIDGSNWGFPYGCGHTLQPVSA